MSGRHLHIRGSVAIPEQELRWRFSRSTGPGGQHVNTSSTAVELSFDVAGSTALPEVYRERARRAREGRLVDGVTTVRASERRSQLRNRTVARARLAALLAEVTAPPPPPRRPTRPSRRANQRRLDEKRRRSEVKRTRSHRDD
jgi:ribosome-associated protein